MSDGADDIAKVQHEAVDVLAKIFIGLGARGRKNDDFFSVKRMGDSVKLTSLLDGKEIDCRTKQDVEKGAANIVGNKNFYDSLIERIPVYDNLKGNANEYFTPKMFNDLGGQDSAILKNIESIGINNYGGIKHSFLAFPNNASADFEGFYLSHHENDKYKVGLIGRDGKEMQWFEVGSKELENKIKEIIQLNEKANLLNKKEGYLFSENEVDKEKLKQFGIKWGDLSEMQKNDLLKGKETSSLTITRNTNGKKIYEKGHLKLARTGANSADILFRQQIGGIKKGLKLKM